MKFSTPPKNQGQIVTISYAMTPSGLIRHTHDRSDGTEVFAIANWTTKLEKWAGSSGPWNTEPHPVRFRGISKRDVDRLDNEEGGLP